MATGKFNAKSLPKIDPHPPKKGGYRFSISKSSILLLLKNISNIKDDFWGKFLKPLPLDGVTE